MKRALLLGCAIAAAAAAGCGGARLRGRHRGVVELIATARDNGAVACAPIELAMAESHADFADEELREGHYYEARAELLVAESNAQAAFDKSPKERCAPRVVMENPLDTDGDGITDDIDECPRKPEDKDGFQDDDGCPDPDNDNDGILDVDDKCPNDPEDKDGFQDQDGCPDPDNDGDGLVDKIDQCPDQAEDKDGFEDDDGCPDCDNDGDGVPECPEAIDKCPDQANDTPDGCPQKYKLVVLTDTKIELKQTVYFDYNKARIKPISFALLDEVAQVMLDHPKIEVRIEGHTDSRGGDAFNLRLSQARANSVRQYLIGRGVDPSRMLPRGYGERMPIADNRTDDGREQNRRVEFFITSQ